MTDTTVAAEVTGDGEITLTSHLNAVPDVAWRALTVPEKLPTWLGYPIIFDLEVGGRIEVEVGDGHRFAGEFVAIEPPERLVFTWGWRSGPIPIEPGSTTVVMTLREQGDGSQLELVHHGLGQWAEFNIVGWSQKLTRLVANHPSTHADHIPD